MDMIYPKLLLIFKLNLAVFLILSRGLLIVICLITFTETLALIPSLLCF